MIDIHAKFGHTEEDHARVEAELAKVEEKLDQYARLHQQRCA
jgi:hypothetical protein